MSVSVSISNGEFIYFTAIKGIAPESCPKSVILVLKGDKAKVQEAWNELKALSQFENFIPPDIERYQPLSVLEDQLFKAIFNKAFSNDPQRTILGVKKINNKSFEPSYPLKRRVFFITLPRIGSALIESRVVKVALSVAAIYATVVFTLKVHNRIVSVLDGRVFPFVLQKMPKQATRIFTLISNEVNAGVHSSLGQYLIKVHQTALLYLATLVLTFQIILHVPGFSASTKDFVSRYSIYPFFFLCIFNKTVSLDSFLYMKGFDVWNKVHSQCSDFASFLSKIAEEEKEKQISSDKESVFVVWKEALALQNIMH